MKEPLADLPPPPGRAGFLRRRYELWSVPGVFVLVALGWEWSVAVLEVPVFILPPPSAIGAALWAGLRTGLFLQHAWVTVLETVLGFGIAAAAAIVLGALIAQIEFVERTLYPYIVGLQTVPKIALAPLLIVWFGFGLRSKIAVAAMVAFFPILVNTVEGLKTVEQSRLDMLRSFDASAWQIFRMIRVPSALPFIFAGLDVGAVLSVLGAVVAEFVGAEAGLGNLMLALNFRMNIAAMFAVLVILAALGIGLHLLVQAVQRRVVFWTRPATPFGA